ncbi:hypothetical protein WDZ92_21670, partial [Nostoc sp. NIES-2111]
MTVQLAMTLRKSTTCVAGRAVRYTSALTLLALLTACGGGSEGTQPTPSDPTHFTIGGRIEGLTTAGLVLENLNRDRVTLPAHATEFAFPVKVAPLGAYAVRIAVQPGQAGAAQDC